MKGISIVWFLPNSIWSSISSWIDKSYVTLKIFLIYFIGIKESKLCFWDMKEWQSFKECKNDLFFLNLIQGCSWFSSQLLHNIQWSQIQHSYLIFSFILFLHIVHNSNISFGSFIFIGLFSFILFMLLSINWGCIFDLSSLISCIISLFIILSLTEIFLSFILFCSSTILFSSLIIFSLDSLIIFISCLSLLIIVKLSSLLWIFFSSEFISSIFSSCWTIFSSWISIFSSVLICLSRFILFKLVKFIVSLKSSSSSILLITFGSFTCSEFPSKSISKNNLIIPSVVFSFIIFSKLSSFTINP